jgi:hypothetical protein
MSKRTRQFWRIAAVLLLTLTLWGAWFVNTQGFSKKWRNYINREFRKHGFEVAIQRLTLDPFRGLVARNVQIFSYGDATRPTGEINEVALDVDYNRLMRGKDFLNAIDLRNSDIKIPLADDTPPLIIQDLSARISLPEGELILRELQATVQGVRVTAEGRLDTGDRQAAQPAAPPRKPRPTDQPEADPAAGTRALIAQWWPRLREELMRYEMQGKPVRLKLGFTGHADDLRSLNVNAHLEGRGLLRDGLPIQHVEIQAQYADNRLTLKNVSLECDQGKLKGTGTFQPGAEDLGRFQVAGTFNFLPAVQPFLPKTTILRDISLQTPPELVIYGSLRRGADGRVAPELLGKLVSDDPVFRGEHFDHLEADFALRGPQWMVQGLKLTHASGQLTGAMRVLPGDVRAEVESTLSSRAIASVLGSGAERALGELEFTRSPEIKLRMEGKALGPENVLTRGSLNLPKFAFRGVWFQSGRAKVRYNDGSLLLEDLSVDRAEGAIRGKVFVDKDANMHLDKLTSKIEAAQLTRLLGPYLERSLQPYRFRENPTVVAAGRVSLRPGGSSDLKIDIDAPLGLDSTLFGKLIPSESTYTRVLYRDAHLQIPDLRAEFFGGELDLVLGIDFGKTQEVAGSVKIKGADYGKLGHAFTGNEKLDGVLTGQADFQAKLGNLRTLEGKGQAEVQSENVFNMSFLGSLSEVLDNTIGFGANKSRSLRVDFDLDEGRVKADPVQVITSGYSLTGTGTYDLVDGSLESTMRAKMRGGPGLLLYPVSKLMEFSASGTLAEPRWRAKNFTRAPRPDPDGQGAENWRESAAEATPSGVEPRTPPQRKNSMR